ncbi:ribosome small subunit-dependent GTPase A [Niveibacterium umoris]|uniref:Small ribosomal subunit biogenesis GTPase RsgA n=1 Tax=Niveibacterium umoris TaxID=1193620 RepID=A0A840BCV9_9RHOO|nr:ribosome small subunit-dependent GTPase A [Niveibacterium umoris]MBB4010870.1 ribosome biogenesis GTPase [Niveibacterium umoris]
MKNGIDGTIVAAFGRQYEVELADGTRLLCFTRAKKSSFACGDHVEVSATAPDQGVIEKLHARTSLLYREDAFKQKLIAANLTQVVIVVATEPSFSPELLTRCLCAVEDQELKALIVLNKADLSDRLADARALLRPFLDVGYEVLETCAKQSVAPLLERLAGEVSLLVGQSGMGKSTLTNALIPDAAAVTAEISTALDSGRHTTTFSRLYRLPGGGTLIDSPGLQMFGLAQLSHDALAWSFREFRPHLGQCRFRDCHHDAEPGCALLAALADGAIAASRFAQYRMLRNELTSAMQARNGHA